MTLRVVLSLCAILLTSAWDEKEATDSSPLFEVDELGLLAIEREQIANHLAGYAVSEWRNAEQPTEELTLWTHRFLGFALALHPGNPRARSALRSLNRAVQPRALPLEMGPDVLAELLRNRSDLLIEQGGETNQILAQYFVVLAFRLDPEPGSEIAQHNLTLDWERVISQIDE